MKPENTSVLIPNVEESAFSSVIDAGVLVDDDTDNDGDNE